MPKLSDIEGIGPTYAAKPTRAGVRSIRRLLAAGGTPAGRSELAEKTGIGRERILEWVDHADLMRIKGIGGEYADLLEAAGVDTVPELASRNPAKLAETLTATNAEQRLALVDPGLPRVTSWVKQAKSLGRMVRY
jgi:predicted flap endonuclease-1-like 5' DNA nuclease